MFHHESICALLSCLVTGILGAWLAQACISGNERILLLHAYRPTKIKKAYFASVRTSADATVQLKNMHTRMVNVYTGPGRGCSANQSRSMCMGAKKTHQ